MSVGNIPNISIIKHKDGSFDVCKTKSNNIGDSISDPKDILNILNKNDNEFYTPASTGADPKKGIYSFSPKVNHEV